LALLKPSAEEEAKVAEATKNKLEALIGGKIVAARPTQLAATRKVGMMGGHSWR